MRLHYAMSPQTPPPPIRGMEKQLPMRDTHTAAIHIRQDVNFTLWRDDTNYPLNFLLNGCFVCHSNLFTWHPHLIQLFCFKPLNPLHSILAPFPCYTSLWPLLHKLSSEKLWRSTILTASYVWNSTLNMYGVPSFLSFIIFLKTHCSSQFLTGWNRWPRARSLCGSTNWHCCCNRVSHPSWLEQQLGRGSIFLSWVIPPSPNTRLLQVQPGLLKSTIVLLLLKPALPPLKIHKLLFHKFNG